MWAFFLFLTRFFLKEVIVNKLLRFIHICLFMALFSGSLFAQTATKLEGEFKTGPAIILIFILILFLMVGILNRAKDTSTYWAAGRKISPVRDAVT